MPRNPTSVPVPWPWPTSSAIAASATASDRSVSPSISLGARTLGRPGQAKPMALAAISSSGAPNSRKSIGMQVPRNGVGPFYRDE